MKKMLFVMNPFAGKRKANRYLADILSIFNRAGYTVTVHMTAGPGDGAVITEQMAPEMDLIVCCGGDGTFNETVHGILRSGADVPIGYIPAGSTNDFATSLKLPTDVKKAAEAIAMGKPHRYDVGRFDNRHFSYVASFGLFTRSSYATPQNVKNVLGHAAYVFSGIQELTHIHTIPMRIELEDEVIEDEFLFGAISNSTCVGGMLKLDPKRVDMQDGLFELLLVRKPKGMVKMAEVFNAIQHQKYDREEVTYREVTHLKAISTQPVIWTLDGERADVESAVEIQNLHRAISLMQLD